MRVLKYILAVLLLGALAAGVLLHLKRESIARGIANDVLAGSGLAVTDLSIARLRADEILFSRLVLEQADGTRYEFRDLHLPLSLPDTTLRRAEIGRLVVRPAPASGVPPAYSEGLDLVFSLPDRFPDSTISIGEIEWPGWPPITGLRWSTGHGDQQLALSVADVELHVHAAAVPGANGLTIEGRTTGAPEPELRADLEFRRSDPGYRMSGTLRFVLEPWVEYARDERLLPLEGLETDAAIGVGVDIEAEIENPGPGDLVVHAVISPDDGGTLGWSTGDGTFTARAGMPSSLELDIRLPAGDWTFRAGPFGANVSHALAEHAEVSVGSVACTPAECQVSGTVHAETIASGSLRADSIDVAGMATLVLAEDWRLDATPTALTVSALQGESWHVDTLESGDLAGFRVSASTNETTLHAERLALDIEGLRVGDGLSGNVRLKLEAMEAVLGSPELKSRFKLPKERLRLQWQDFPIVPALIEGRIDYLGSAGEADVQVTDPARALSATVHVKFSADRAVAALTDASLGFDTAPLSASVAGWTRPWDLVDGRAHASGSVEWLAGDGGTLGAEGHIELENVAATWNDLGATGIRASIPVRLAPGSAAAIGPVTASAALVDVGLPLEDATAEITWDTATPDLEIRGLGMGLLGGRLTAAPFVFDIENGSAALAIDVDAVQLGLIPALADFEAVEVTGTVFGRIPVQVDGGTVTVDDGHLENEPPGGVIRYRAQDAPEGGSGLAMAQRALSNLQYESLASDVTYSKEGDLVMKLRLKGVNPDLDPLQPVILNLTVENNIPQLLKSLQATRDIQDVIESRTRKTPAKTSP